MKMQMIVCTESRKAQYLVGKHRHHINSPESIDSAKVSVYSPSSVSPRDLTPYHFISILFPYWNPNLSSVAFCGETS